MTENAAQPPATRARARKRKPASPLRYGPEVHELLVESMRQMGDRRLVADLHGLARDTLKNWCHRHPRLADDMAAAGLEFRRNVTAQAKVLGARMLERYLSDLDLVPPAVARDAIQIIVPEWGMKKVEHSGEVGLRHWVEKVVAGMESDLEPGA